MRIISGKYKGRQIDPPRGSVLRPTTDVAREALFNIIVHRMDISSMTVMDLFAGSGAVSFEFLSRDCKHVVAVEQQARLVSHMRDLAGKLGEENLIVLRRDVRRYLAGSGQPFDLVFADPPYDLAWISELPSMVLTPAWIKPGGWFILEHGSGHDFAGNTCFLEHRHYGHVHFSFFEMPRLNP